MRGGVSREEVSREGRERERRGEEYLWGRY
jgi:hypothetical protein